VGTGPFFGDYTKVKVRALKLLKDMVK